MASDQELVQFYQKYYEKGNFGLFEHKELHKTLFEEYDGMTEVELSEKFNYVLGHKKGGKFLDIGFGLGDPLYLADKFGFDVYGTEYDKDSIEFVKSYLPNSKLTYGGILDAQYENDTFDFIRFWHVIEHVREPDIYISEIKRIIRKDGILMIGTPNISCKAYLIHRFINFHLHRIPTILDGTDHTVLFTKSRLRDLLDQFGFRIIKHTSEGRKEELFDLIKQKIPLRKKVARLLQSVWDVDQTLYAIQK
jgi:2-polyprenyl-3-methyl-5-hydroxy-6-metoxy-1,4-benzoquinol methylase